MKRLLGFCQQRGCWRRATLECRISVDGREAYVEGFCEPHAELLIHQLICSAALTNADGQSYAEEGTQ